MAKRSDFAQKLLDDLRVRKERMAAASHSSKGSNSSHGGDAYGYSKHAHRGSRDMKSQSSNGYRSSDAHIRSSGGKKLLTSHEAANQIVTYGGRGQNSGQIDLSMALAFAFENGGKLKVMDSGGNGSVFSFLKNFGRKTMDNRNSVDIRTASGRFPTLTNLQIKEISKGAQKLNQILRGCSNGINIDSYSIEIGKELLKGAMDLEESLRMLVNLQEASDHMVTPQRKSRIRLLDEDEDEDEDENAQQLVQQKQLDLPKFSFDKRSRNQRNIKESARFEMQQRVLALTYSSSNAPSSGSHRRSSSYSTQLSNFDTFSDKKSQSVSSQSKSEKARIPNVVARLMGLDDLPSNLDSKHADSQKEANSKQKTEVMDTKKAAQASTKKAEKRTNEAEVMLPSPVKHKVMKTDKPHYAGLDMVRLRHLPAHNGSFDAGVHDRKLPWKEVEGTKPMTGSRKVMADIDKQQSYAGQFTASNKDNSKHSEQKGTKKNETDMQMSKQIHRRSEVAAAHKDKSRSKESALQTEKRYSNKSSNDHRVLQPQVQQKSEPRKEFHPAEERYHQSEVISNHFQMNHSPMNQVSAGSKTSTALISEMKSENFTNSKNHENLATDGRSNGHSPYQNSDHHLSPRQVVSELAKANNIVHPAMEEKMVQLPAAQKTRSLKVHKLETPRRRIEEVVTKKTGNSQGMIKLPKQRSTNLQELKQRMRELSDSKEAENRIVTQSKDAKAHILKSTNSVSSIPPLEEVRLPKQEAMRNECQILEEPPALSRIDNIHGIMSRVTSDHSGQEPKICEQEQFQSSKTASNLQKGFHKDNTEISYTFQIKSQAQKPLTESEIHLKRVLIQSQLFLNTAEALFKLNIPVAILQANGHDWHDQESKLILDCGYELMRRIGRKQELNLHPCSTNGSSSTTMITCSMKMIRSLDDLVRQLNREVEKLQLYGRDGNADCLLEDYLPKMLESDVYNKEADVNCMWDFGWDEKMFAFIEKDEVVKDLEKSLLNGLIDEITKDLVVMCI